MGAIDIMMIIIVSIVGITLLVGIVTIIFWAADSLELPVKTTDGVITAKQWTQSTTQFTLLGGKVPMMQTIPAHWDLLIQTAEGPGWVSVDKDFYYRVAKGEKYQVKYSIARYSKAVIVKSIFG